jgi:hypothetical protein
MFPRTRTTRKTPKATARSVYGELKLLKGTVLYHTSQTPFVPTPTKPMLFTTFHPTDWDVDINEYVTQVTLLRDVSLLFMVGGFQKARILPLLDTLIQKPGHNLKKQNSHELGCYISKLQKEEFDGWFSTIEGKAAVEVALINDSTMFDTITLSNSETTDSNIDSNTNTTGNVHLRRRFRKKYPITTIPIKLTLNSRFKDEIEQYKTYCENYCRNYFVFQFLLNTAIIQYFDAPTIYVTWDC